MKHSAHLTVICAVLFSPIFGAHKAPFLIGRRMGLISSLPGATGVSADRPGTERLDGGSHLREDFEDDDRAWRVLAEAVDRP